MPGPSTRHIEPLLPAGTTTTAFVPLGISRRTLRMPPLGCTRRARISSPPLYIRPKSETLVDTLDATAIVATLWAETINGGVTVNRSAAGLAYTMPAVAGTGDSARVNSVITYDVTNSHFQCKIPTVFTSGGLCNVQMSAASADNLNVVLVQILTGNIAFVFLTFGSQTVLASIPYDPVAHAWVRIRESAGTTFWETSPDGYTWTTRATADRPCSLENMTMRLRVGCNGADTNPGTGTFIFYDTNGPFLSFSRAQRRQQTRPLGRRARRVEVPVEQLAPGPVMPVSVRRTRTVVLRRPRRADHIPGQHVPTIPPQTRRARVQLRARRSRPIEVVPTVTGVVQSPDVMWSPFRVPRRALVRRARARVEVVPPQFNPPFPFAEIVQPRRPRGLLARRARRVEVVPLQELISSPPPKSLARRAIIRRARARVEVVPTQATVVQSPDVMWSPTRAPRRALVRRPRARVEAPLTQAAAPVDPSVMWSPTRVPRRALVRRPRARVEVVPAQLNPPFPFRVITQPRRLRGMQPRRRARVETYPAKRIYFPKIRLF